MDATVSENGAITIPARRFFQLIRELNTEEIELRVTSENKVYISALTSEFSINGMDHSEYPKIPDLSGAGQFTIPINMLKELFTKSVFAAAKDDSRHVLNGVLMQIENSNATFIGTDGKRLARVNGMVEIDPTHQSNYLIPIKAVDEIVKTIGSDSTVKVSLTPEKIGVESSSMTIITNLLSGDYPDIERVIPKTSKIAVLLHREELMTLLKQVSLFTCDKSHSVQFHLEKGELTLTANSSDFGKGRVSMPIDYSGDPFDIAFNPFYFHDILKHCVDETVNFSITTPHNPGLITDSSTANYVIMPMRLASV